MKQHRRIVVLPLAAFLVGSLGATEARGVPGGTTGGPALQVAEVDTDFAYLLEAHAAPGAVVQFAAPYDGPSAILSASSAIADEDGVAVVAARAGTVTGSYVVYAGYSSGQVLEVFPLRNIAGAPANMVAMLGSTPQHAAVDTAFANSLATMVHDRFGNGVPGVRVRFTAPGRSATGTANVGEILTDENGAAKVGFTAGTVAGAYQVTASTDVLTTAVAFELTNLHGAPHHVVAESGDGQRAEVDTAFAEPLVLRVEDAHHNPVKGAPLYVTAPGTGATARFDGPPAVTDVDGRAVIALAAGTVRGSYQISASAALGMAPVVFTLGNDAGAPASISALPGATPQTTRATDLFAERLAVVVADRFGNPVTGTRVLFTAPSAVELERTDALTGDDGVAAIRARAGHVAGAYSISARVGGVGYEAFFALTQTAGNPAHVVATEGGGQRTLVGTAFAEPVRFRVVDGVGNPVAGAAVTISAPATGATAIMTPGAPLTGADGTVAIAFTAGALPGTVTLFATVDGAAAPARVTLAVESLPATAPAAGDDADADPALEEPDALQPAGCSASGGGSSLGMGLALLAAVAILRRRAYTRA